MSNYNEEKNTEFSLRDFFNIIKRNLLLILAVVILCGAVGFVYSNYRKPYYVATQEINYSARELKTEGGVASGDSVANINMMDSLKETVMDFCLQEVVIYRANYYYNKFANSNMSLEDFVKKYEVEDDFTYGADKVDTSSILLSNITITSPKGSNADTVYYFKLSYKDSVQEEAVNKVKLLLLAFSKEVNSTANNTDKYFGNNLEIILTDRGFAGTTTDVSQTKIIVIFLLVGFVLAAVIVYLRVLLDNTIKDEETLRRLTGANLLAHVNQEVK